MFYVYILRNPQNKLYIGSTHDIGQRLQYHHLGKAALFTKEFKNFHLVYFEEYQNLISARKREKQLKGWTRAKKEALIENDFDLLKKL